MAQTTLDPRQKLTGKEKALIAGSVLYVLLVAVYLLAWPATALKYISAGIGFALLALIPELVRGQHKRLLILLVAGVAVGNTAMQAKDDADKDRAIAELKLEKWRDLDVKEAERKIRVQERVYEDPIDTIRALQHSPLGFESKANRLSMRAKLEESRLLAAQPQLAERVLRFPGDAERRLAAYAAVREEGGARAARPAIDAVVAVLKEEAAYRAAAKYLVESIVPQYKALAGRAERGKIEPKPLLEAMRAIERKLDARLAAAPLAGLFNHAGVLAMGQSGGQRALGRYYQAMAADPEHVPAYESIAYASWSVNQEARTAIEYARRGLELAARYAQALAAEYAELQRNHAAVARAVPAAAAALRAQKEQASKLVDELKASFTRSSTGMVARLQLLYAYCSALELQNESAARRYARALHDADPKDPEHQDALGLVLLVFAKTPDELDEADRLLVLAGSNPKAEQMTRKLVVMHRAKVDEKRRLLGFRK